MAKIETSTMIKRPVAEVFAVVSNPESIPKWNTSTIEVQRASAGAIGGGMT